MLYFWAWVFSPFTFLFSSKWFQFVLNLSLWIAAVVVIPIFFPLAFLMWVLCVVWAWGVANDVGRRRAVA